RTGPPPPGCPAPPADAQVSRARCALRLAGLVHPVPARNLSVDPSQSTPATSYRVGTLSPLVGLAFDPVHRSRNEADAPLRFSRGLGDASDPAKSLGAAAPAGAARRHHARDGSGL